MEAHLTFATLRSLFFLSSKKKMHSELLKMELLINPITEESQALGSVSVEGGASPVGEMNNLPVHISPHFVLITFT